jgi:hypothetical protein
VKEDILLKVTDVKHLPKPVKMALRISNVMTKNPKRLLRLKAYNPEFEAENCNILEKKLTHKFIVQFW